MKGNAPSFMLPPSAKSVYTFIVSMPAEQSTAALPLTLSMV